MYIRMLAILACVAVSCNDSDFSSENNLRRSGGSDAVVAEAKLEVSPSKTTVTLNESAKFFATMVYGQSRKEDVTMVADWKVKLRHNF